MNRWLKLLLCICIPLAALLIPGEWIPIKNLSPVEHHLLAVFLLALMCWILEPIPIFATSVMIIVLELLFLSDGGFTFVIQQGAEYGNLLSYKSVMASFAHPIILLFLGGFFLATAATKYKLDVNLARAMLKPFGSRPAFVMLGMMIITAVFSMFMSNTATTALMLAIIIPVLRIFPEDDPGRIGMVLAVPFAANIGGLGTPIGTPPNAVAMKYLTGEMSITFAGWMEFAVPYVVVLLFICWGILNLFFSSKTKALIIDLPGAFEKSPRAVTVYITFIITIILWLTGGRIGLNSYVTAMIPVLVFSVSGILKAEDIRSLHWDILWLMAGGLALGYGLEATGLSTHIIESVPFQSMHPLSVILVSAGIAALMATVMSHTATANLILPITAALGVSLPSLIPFGGTQMLILATTFGCSIGMALPISTPPNAMAFGTGMIQTKYMLKAGIVVEIIGFGLIFLLGIIMLRFGFFS